MGSSCYKIAKAAIVSKGIGLLLCPSFSGNDVVTCQTKMGSRDLYLVSVYLDINGGIPGKLTRLLDSGLPESVGLIIGGNVNVHSTMWGSKEINRRGELVEDLTFRHNLSLCNRGVTSTFVTRRASSIIHLTLCSSNIFESVRRWKVNKDDLYFDHRRIKFTLEGLECSKKADQLALKRANLQAFQAFTRAEMFRTHRHWTPTTLDIESNRLVSDIKTSLSKVCEKSKSKPRQSQR